MDKLKILFFGTPDFSVPALKALLEDVRFEVCALVTQPDKPAGRGQKMRMSAIKELALEYDLPVFQPGKIKAEEDAFLSEISKTGAVDFGVVIAFGQILPEKTLKFPKYGCINIHASLLPRWRGAAPIQRALLAGDKKTGVCIMQMEQGLDTGPVFSSEEIAIDSEDTAASLHDKLSVLGSKLLIKTLPEISCGSVHAVPQSKNGLTYAEKITAADLKLDWKDSAENLDLKVRTFSPKPGAYTFLEGKRLKVLKSVIENRGSAGKTPGEIFSTSSDCFSVQAGENSLSICELQLEGKKAMSVAEFLRGYPAVTGKILG